MTSNLKNEPKPLRLFSSGTVYRYDEPQRGRYREFWQSNFELIGSDKPEADAEIVLLTNFLMTNLGLKYYAFKIGSIGVIRGILNADGIDEKTQNNVLQLMDKKDLDSALKLVDSEKCRTTLKGLINIKGENWQETIEKMKSYLEYYDEAKIAVENLHLTLNLITESTNIKLTLEPAFARGLEYYTGMIFEVYIPQLDIALGGGGRYDRLIETFGGEPTPAVGCAHGIDRVALALQIQGTTFELTTEKRVVVIPITDAVRTQAFKIAQSLRLSGVAVEFEVMGRKMVKALEDADKRKIGFAVIVGERELKEDAVVLKDLVNRKQKQVTLKNLVEEIKN